MLLARALTASFLWAALACAASSAPGTRAAKPTEALAAESGSTGGLAGCEGRSAPGRSREKSPEALPSGGAWIVHAMNATIRL
jgi:hypothetical protein